MKPQMGKGLMAQEEPEREDEDDSFEGKSEKDIDSDLLFNSALAFLGTPEGTQGVVQTVQGAKDVGTAIGKMAAMVVIRIVKELEAGGVTLTSEGIFDADGGLTKVIVVIYTLANVNGVQIPMDQSFEQAYLVAEADVEKALSGASQPEQMTNAPVS